MAIDRSMARRLRRGSAAAVATVVGLATVTTSDAAVTAVAPGIGSAAQGAPTDGTVAPSDPTWALSTTDVAAAAAAPAYLGNGYLGTRVPATGAGWVEAPVATETHVAGVYADVPDPITGGVQHEGSVNLPGWTRVDLVVDGRRWTGSGADGYQQTLDLRRGSVVTTASWTVGRRTTDLRYEVVVDRSRPRVGTVSLTVTPRWSGTLRVADVLGDGAMLTPGALSGVSAAADRRDAMLVVRARGTGTTVATASRLDLPRGAEVTASDDAGAMTVRRDVRMRVTAGRSYVVSKVVGVATSRDARDPAGAARTASQERTASAVVAESVEAWRRLWSADVAVPGDVRLQQRIRAAMFYLLASARPDVDASISPVGLSAGGYNNHVFWDAETWMYPALLAQHPAEASMVVDYRYATRAGARANAAAGGWSGLRFAWESAQSGREVTPTWAETGQLEQHVTSDVALAQWQHYLATGDEQWLRTRGWPVIRGAADFWASRAETGAGGAFHIRDVEGPDEQNWPVDDSVYTNATAATTLRIAVRAAAVVAAPAPARWTQVADGLVVQAPGPADGLPAVRPEFAGYAGQQVKQADVVLLSYPWEYDQSVQADRSALDYYTPRYDPDGPAMTDSVSSIVAARLAQGTTADDVGCSAWTYTRRSVDPFAKAPYEQFTEARSGQGVFTFLTGEGGFLQEFLYGYTGLRWREDRVVLDPYLPPALSRGLAVTGMRWQGRVFDVAVASDRTTVTLRSGEPMVVDGPDGRVTVSVGTPVALPTRTTAAAPDDLARCRPASAAVSDPSAPPEAAVDGSAVTAWQSGADPATESTLEVALADAGEAVPAVDAVTARWSQARPLAAYAVQVRPTPDAPWRTVATVSGPSTRLVDAVTFAPTLASSVRLVVPPTRMGGQNPRLADLEVSPAPR